MEGERIKRIKEIRKIQKTKRIKTIGIIVGVIAIIVIGSIVINGNKNTISGGNNSNPSNNSAVIKQDTEKNKSKAIEIAIDKFNELGEKDINKDELEVLSLNREGQLCYYISSANNSVEVRVKDMKIIRVNSVVVNN